MKQDRPSRQAYSGAAWMLGSEAAALQAIAEVEAGAQGAFYDDGTPVILFERHKFHQETGSRYDDARVPGAPEEWARISDAKAGGYGPSSAQHTRLQYAAAFNREAALRSASWGLFQIMGSNYEQAGFRHLQDFINAMYASVDDHLRALVFFIWNDRRLLRALQTRDWGQFAFLYNGPRYRDNHYDTKIAQMYAQLVTG